MLQEKDKDPEIRALRLRIQQGRSEKYVLKKHMLIDDMLHFLSSLEHNPTVRLYVPAHYRPTVLKSYHDDHGYFGVETFDSIREKYYWPNLYKEINDHVSKCITCSLRNLKKLEPSKQETDIPLFILLLNWVWICQDPIQDLFQTIDILSGSLIFSVDDQKLLLFQTRKPKT